MFNNLILFSALSTMTGSLGQATYTSCNSSLESIVFGCRLVRSHIAANALMWGAVGDIGMRWKSFATDDFLARSEPKCRCIVLLRAFKGTDAKIGGCVFPRVLQTLCDVKPSMREHA